MEAVAAKHTFVMCLFQEVVQDVGKISGRRVKLVGGNMFDPPQPKTIPKYDAIFLKDILLCDWDEDNSRAVMESCHKVLPPGGTATVSESVLPTSHGYTDGSLSISV
jgi:hypothetical protein